MSMYIMSAFIIVLSNICYNVFQKNISADINPFISLMVTYAVGILVSVLLFFLLYKGKNIGGEFMKINLCSVLLGVAIVGLETGFLLAYRAGWSMSVAVILTNALVTIALIPIGVIFFKESFSLTKCAGIVLCLAGLFLLNYTKSS